MVRRLMWILGLVVLGVTSGLAQTYGPGEIYYGGILLQFSGRVVVAGTCSPAVQPAPGVSQIQCQVQEGTAGTVELTATRTPAGAVNIRVESVPSGWPNSLWIHQLGQWVDSRSAVASGWGTVQAQYQFTPPTGSAGRRVELRFKAWTTGVIGELELRVILDIVRGVTPTPPPTEPTVPSTYGPFTGTTEGEGRFEVPIPTLPNTYITGQLTECTVKPLPNRQVSVTLVPKAGITTISRADQIGAVRISSSGYAEVAITELRLLSSMDLYGRVYTTVDVGAVCLRPTAPPVTPPPVTPTAPIRGKTDAEGKFTLSLPWPGTTVSGRLTECTVKPLPNQEFTLTMVPKGQTITSADDIAGFTFKVPGYRETTVTHFSKLSLFSLTWYDTGPLCLTSDRPRCKERGLRVLTQNCQLIPEVWIRTPPLVGLKTTVYGGTPFRDARCAEFARLAGAGGQWTEVDIVCLQEVFSHAGENHAFKNAIAGAWLGDPNLDLTRQPWFTLDRERAETVGHGADASQIIIMRREPPGTDVQQVTVLKKGDRWVVGGPDSTASPRYTLDGGLVILSQHPVIAASGFTFSNQAGIVEEMSNKGALYARIQLDPTNTECYIHVFNTHLAARSPEFTGPVDGKVPHPDNNWAVRQKQIEELVTFISNCIRDDGMRHPIILCGDFNVIAPFPVNWCGDLVVPAGVDVTKGIASPQYDAVVNMLAAHKLSDGWKEKRPEEPGFTWLGNNWKTEPGSPWEDKGNPLAIGPGWPQRLDYIFYNAGAEASLITLRLDEIERTKKPQDPFKWDNTQSYVLSDHLGLVARFTVSPK